MEHEAPLELERQQQTDPIERTQMPQLEQRAAYATQILPTWISAVE